MGRHGWRPVFPHISSLLSPEISLCNERWRVKWSFFVHHASPLSLLQGPRTVTTQTASSPSSSRDLQTHTDPPCTPPAIYWWTLLDGKGLAPAISQLGERRGDRRDDKKKKQRFRNTLQHNGLSQGSTEKDNLIQDCHCLIILVELTSFLHNIIVALLYWSIIQQLYQEHNDNEKWRDGSFVLAAETLLKYS